jgi:hypothetical protein
MTRPAIFYLPNGGEDAVPREPMLPGGPGRHAIDGVKAIKVIGDHGAPPRTGLAVALELIASGEATVLAVTQLRDVASSLGDLVRLLAWLAEAGADLIAADVGFDSGAAGAPQAIALLREVDRWDHEPHPARPARGRPGLSSVDPELAERLARLRRHGLSLQAIAALLNGERLPTPRGGAEWRPSSVQAALGYRRPRPPAPGGPPGLPPHPSSPGAPHVPGPRGPAPPHKPPKRPA